MSSSSLSVVSPPPPLEAVRGFFVSSCLQVYFYPRRNVLSVYKRAADGEILAFKSFFWDGLEWKSQENLNKTIAKILKSYKVYLLCYKGGVVKERNALVPSCEDMETDFYRPSTFTMIIREQGAFYACVSDRFIERHRHRVDPPFNGGVVTDSIMDLGEYVHIKKMGLSHPFDLTPLSEFKPCEDINCYCKTRGLTNGQYHICPICKSGVLWIKRHMLSFHELDFYPTYAEIPKPLLLPSPDLGKIKELLVDIGHLGPSLRVLKKLKRAREREEATAGNADRPPSVKKTTQGGDSGPPEIKGDVLG